MEGSSGNQCHPLAENSSAPLDPIRRGLQENEDWYQDLVEHSNDLLCIHDLGGRLLSINPAPARVLGYSVEELLHTPMRDVVAPEFQAHFDAYLRQIAQIGESRGLMTVLTKAGERRIWDYHNTLQTEGVASPIVRGMAHDVTERIRAERLLREANQKLLKTAEEREQRRRELTLFRTLMDQSNDAIEIVDPNTLRFLDVNQKACRALGYTREELLALRVPDINPSITDFSIQEMRETFSKSGLKIMESVHCRKDGSIFPVEVSMRCVHHDRDYVVVITRDLTERMQAETSRRESEARERIRSRELETVLDTVPVAVFLSRDSDGRNITTNRAGYEQLGLPEGSNVSLSNQAGPKPAFRVFREGLELAGDQLPMQVVAATGLPVERVPLSIVRKDGSEKHTIFNAVPLRDVDGRLTGVVGASIDVTHLRKLTEELREAKEKLAEEKLYLEETIDVELGFGEIIGKSGTLRRVMEKVARVAPSNSTVLLLGETGTGKELVARAIHRLSGCKGNNFIKVNCAAVPSGLLESELFGHEKGAFTGALARKLGRIELANNGTIFLDEVGEIPLDIQPKLLRVLQDHEFERLGGTRTLRTNFRLVAATNRDLRQSIHEGRFRSDLYYRLNVFPIHLPALRERRDDIPLLVEHFVRKHAERTNKSILSVPTKTMDALMGWDWPGNIRELENFVERSVILTSGSVLQVPLGELEAEADKRLNYSPSDREREHIVRALRECGGQISGASGAATRLGLKRATLQSKITQFGIKAQEYST